MSPLQSHGPNESFLRGHGSSFPQQDVTIIRNPGTEGEERLPARAIIQSKSGIFDVDTPIYEGDIVELDDPRGGVRHLKVDELRISDTRGGTAFSGMSHITAKWSDAKRPVQPRVAGGTIYNGPVIFSSGDHVQIAWNNESVTNTSSSSQVAPGFESLGEAVVEALRVIIESGQFQREDRSFAEESARLVLQEVTKDQPDPSILRRALAGLRGVLVTATNTAVGATARALVDRLVLGA